MAEADPDKYSYYDYSDLFRMKICRSRSDLSRRIKAGEFPAPEKSSPSMQGKARYRRDLVHAAIDRMRALREAEQPQQPRRPGRPRKEPEGIVAAE